MKPSGSTSTNKFNRRTCWNPHRIVQTMIGNRLAHYEITSRTWAPVAWATCIRGELKKLRSNFPSSRRASAKLFGRGKAASLRRITEAVTVPVLIDRARRSSSNQ
jgi:hypothetical protein